MPGDIYRTKVFGDPLNFPAELYNKLTEKAQGLDFDRSQDEPPFNRSNVIVKVRNQSGGNLDRFAILQVDVATILPTENPDEFKSKTLLDGITPTGGGKFVILLEPIASGEIGRAVISGASPVQLSSSGVGLAFCDSENANSATLVPGSTGSARILWTETTGSDYWAVVRFPDGSADGTSSPVFNDVTAEGDLTVEGDTYFEGGLIFVGGTTSWTGTTAINIGSGITINFGGPIYIGGQPVSKYGLVVVTSGTTYTIDPDDDLACLLVFTNSTVAVTLPDPTPDFFDGWRCAIQNDGSGTVTLTPTTSLIDGLSALAIPTMRGVQLYTNGTDWYTERGMGNTAAVTNALLDGTNHTDTVAQGVTRGSLIVGNSTPKWDELVIGSANKVLVSDGTDAGWAYVNLNYALYPPGYWHPGGYAQIVTTPRYYYIGLMPGTVLAPANTLTLNNKDFAAFPWIARRTGVIDTVKFKTAVGQAGSKVQMGFYANTSAIDLIGTGAPLHDLGEAATTASNTVVTYGGGLGIAVTAGTLYWFAANVSASTAPSFVAFPASVGEAVFGNAGTFAADAFPFGKNLASYSTGLPTWPLTYTDISGASFLAIAVDYSS